MNNAKYFCSIPDCGRQGHRTGPKTGKRLCNGHFHREVGVIPEDKPMERRVRRTDTACKAAGCPKVPRTCGMCHGHYARFHAGLKDWASPLRAKGRAMQYRNNLQVRLSDFAVAAVERRSAVSGVPVSALLRAMVERWAMTDGAETQQVKYAGDDPAWKRTDYDVREEA